MFLGFALILAGVSIELNFAKVASQKGITAVVESVKPARLGSRIQSVRVKPETDVVDLGTGFFRYNSERVTVQLSGGEKLPFVIERGWLGLHRSKPTPEYSFLRVGFLGGN